MQEATYRKRRLRIAVTLALLGVSASSTAQTVLINTDSTVNGAQQTPAPQAAVPPLPRAGGAQPPLPISDSSQPPLPVPARAVTHRHWLDTNGEVIEDPERPASPASVTPRSAPPLPFARTEETAPPLPLSGQGDVQEALNEDSVAQISSDAPLPMIDVRGGNRDTEESNTASERNDQRTQSGFELAPHLDPNDPESWTQHAENRPTATAFFEEPKETWSLQPGSLREQMLSWGHESDLWNVLWFGSNDYSVQVSHDISADLDEAVIQVIEAFVNQGAALSIVRSRANHTIAIRSNAE